MKQIMIVMFYEIEEFLLEIDKILANLYHVPIKFKCLKINYSGIKVRDDQYDGVGLLKKMKSALTDEDTVYLGITNVDMYMDHMNFVFGVASGNHCVVSTARLIDEDADVYAKRVLTEAVHEIGHTFGLDHCKKKDCVMYHSKTIADSDKKGWLLCEDCATKLQ